MLELQWPYPLGLFVRKWELMKWNNLWNAILERMPLDISNTPHSGVLEISQGG